ncbi:MAG: hypothetical protein ACTTIC_06350 [Helicobacteraceae bacterium]
MSRCIFILRANFTNFLISGVLLHCARNFSREIGGIYASIGGFYRFRVPKEFTFFKEK